METSENLFKFNNLLNTNSDTNKKVNPLSK